MATNKEGRYDVFLYRYENERPNTGIEEAVRETDESVGVTIRDISDDDAADRVKFLSFLIMAERNRMYKEGIEKNAYIDLVKYSKTQSLVLVSILSDDGDSSFGPSLLRKLFGTMQYSYIQGAATPDDCNRFWKNSMKDYALTGKKEYAVQYVKSIGETYDIKLESEQRYKELLEKSPKKVKAIFSDALGKIMCRVANLGNVLGEDIHSKGQLSRVPVWVNEKCSNESVETLNEYFLALDRYDRISFTELKNISKIDLEISCMYTQSFIYDVMYKDVLKDLSARSIYKIDASQYSNSPLLVTFILDADTPFVSYDYDPSYFEKVSFEGFNRLLCKIVDDSLNEIYKEFDEEKYLKKVDDTAAKIQAAKEACIRKSKWFNDFDDKEITKLAADMQIVRKLSQECVINYNTSPDKVYLLAYGKIILEGRDMQGYVRSLMLIKDGDFFGIESVLSNKSNADYRVESKEAILLAIDADRLWQIMSDKPELFKDVLRTQTERLNKFAKLWSMS